MCSSISSEPCWPHCVFPMGCPPGYHAYCHYLKTEVSQSHPLMRAFCLLLLQPTKPQGPPEPRMGDLEEGEFLQPGQGLPAHGTCFPLPSPPRPPADAHQEGTIRRGPTEAEPGTLVVGLHPPQQPLADGLPKNCPLRPHSQRGPAQPPQALTSAPCLFPPIPSRLPLTFLP